MSFPDGSVRWQGDGGLIQDHEQMRVCVGDHLGLDVADKAVKEMRGGAVEMGGPHIQQLVLLRQREAIGPRFWRDKHC